MKNQNDGESGIDAGRERWKRMLEDEVKLIETICECVAMGNSIITLARTWEIRYTVISKWIRAKPERKKLYDSAVEDRKEWFVERLLMEMKTIAVSDLRQLFNDDGSLKPPSEWSEEASQFISSIEINELFEGTGKERELIGHTKKIKLWDKSKSIDQLGKHLAMFIDRVEHSGKVTLADILAASYVVDDDKKNEP